MQTPFGFPPVPEKRGHFSRPCASAGVVPRVHAARANRGRTRAALAAALMIALAGNAGCRPFGLYDRRAADSLDDWESPHRNEYSMPQRYGPAAREAAKLKAAQQASGAAPASSEATEKVAAKPAAETAANKPPPQEVAAAKPSAEPQAAPAAAPKPAQPAPSPQASAEAVTAARPGADPLQTPQQDLDIEAALAALPPELQVVLRQQWLAAQNRAGTADAASAAIASGQPASPVQLAASIQPAASGKPDSAVQQASTAKPPALAGDAAATVRVSLSDRSDAPTPAADAKPPAAPAGEKLVAAPAAAKPSDPAVITAAAITPLSTTAAAPGSGEVQPAAAVQPAVADTTSVTPASSVAPAPAPSADWPAARDAAIERLSDSLADAAAAAGETPQQRLQRELALRMLYLSADRLDDALSPIGGLQADEQEYYRHQLQALYESVNPEGVPVASRRWAVVMDSQQRAMQRLAAVSLLQVRNAAFCTDVQGYGMVTPFRVPQFHADQDVLLYCELENVTAEQSGEGFETQLQGNYEIVDRQGNRVADQMLPIEKELCRNYRRDYFMVYRIFMPMQIAPGSYELRLTIEDMKGKKFGQSKLDFQIVDKPRG